LFGRGEVCDETLGGGQPADVTAREFGDGPVATEKQACRPKRFKEVRDVGLKMRDRPTLMIGFRY
jgi:hypothetical protein